MGHPDYSLYAEMREAQYLAGTAQADDVGDAPAVDISNRVGLILGHWDPAIAGGLLRGLYARFALDPRITPAALQLYLQAVEAQSPGALSRTP